MRSELKSPQHFAFLAVNARHVLEARGLARRRVQRRPRPLRPGLQPGDGRADESLPGIETLAK